MRARDQSSIFSIGRKFRPDYGLLLELHALTLVARSYALLIEPYHLHVYESVSILKLELTSWRFRFTDKYFAINRSLSELQLTKQISQEEKEKLEKQLDATSIRYTPPISLCMWQII